MEALVSSKRRFPRVEKIREACDRTGYSPRSVRDWIARGWVRGIRIKKTGDLRVVSEDVDRLLEESLVPRSDEEEVA